MLKVAILGYGGIARSHRKGYNILAEQGAPVELVALCDIDPAQFEKGIVINSGGDQKEEALPYRTYTDLEEMLEKEDLDIIDICLPTYLHCEYATKLLRRGYHVQSEKPMGLNQAECDAMMKAAEESGKKLMIGMCLRFDAMYLALKKMIDEETYGKVESAYFERLSDLPVWGFEQWFQDYNKAGGVALDMHIHDVDMVRYLFGEPKAVSAVTNDAKTKCTTIHSRFLYEDKLVFAIGDWGRSNSTKFGFSCKMNFERASIEMDTKEIRVFPQDGEPFVLDVDKTNHMAEEIHFFARTILGEIENTCNTPADAAGSVRLVDKLMESAANNGAFVEV